MKIIALLNEKGGTGKSTLSINLATRLHRLGRRVVLVDADPQGTARDWRSNSPEGADLPNVVALDRPQMLASITSLAADLVVIDTPAKADLMAAGVVRIANIALVVIQPSGADVWASAAAVQMIKQKQELGGSVDAAFLLNRTSAVSKLTKAVVAGEWNDYGLEQLTATVGNRVAFAQALTDGVSIYETSDSAAQAEINSIITELELAKWL